ncbi:MAG: hypothetical protein HDR10_03460 [Lachnospiraceae bacterium]|nr:hypothetical protein [Lachnospiraceae bacterium]
MIDLEYKISYNFNKNTSFWNSVPTENRLYYTEKLVFERTIYRDERGMPVSGQEIQLDSGIRR